MTEPFFYIVQGTCFRSKGSETDLIEVHEIFKNENPLIAREKAFRCYQNYIDVMLESKGIKDATHEETQEILQDFFSSYKKHFMLNNPDLEIDMDADKGLNIYLVMNNSKTFTTKEGMLCYSEKLLIHYIDKQHVNLDLEVFNALQNEYALYEKLQVDYKKHTVEYDVSGLFDEPKIKTVLKTPIDFYNMLAELHLNKK